MFYFVLFAGLVVSYYTAPALFRVLLIVAAIVLFAMMASLFIPLLLISRLL